VLVDSGFLRCSPTVLLQSSDIDIIVNARLVGPAKLATEGWGVLVAIRSALQRAILLVSCLAGRRTDCPRCVVLASLMAV